MALGVDQLYAQAALELKEEGYPVELYCAIPCQNHDCKWPDSSRKIYKEILKRADDIYLVTDAPYNAYLMQKWNDHMVDMSDEILAVWDGSAGGTENCVKYGREKNKEIFIKSPSDFKTA